MTMNDPDIRQFLISRFSKRKSFSNEMLLEEVSLQNGLVRADMVVCSNKLECYEIKSHGDTLKRLVHQGWQYEQSFDHVTLVCATKHLEHALSIVPEWWGIIEVTKSSKLKTLRRAKTNPYITISGLVDILTNDESRKFLVANNHATGISKLSHAQLKTKIQQVTTLPKLRKWIIDTLPKRESNWRPSSLSNLSMPSQLSCLDSTTP